MRMLTKAEACRELAVSLSTLDRRIASGEIQIKLEPRGRRHRVYVVMDDDPPEDAGNAVSGDSALPMAQERIRGLEEQVAFLEGQLHAERKRYDRLLNDVKAGKFHPGVEDFLRQDRVNHRLRVAPVGTPPPALVVQSDWRQRPQPGPCLERRQMGDGGG